MFNNYVLCVYVFFLVSQHSSSNVSTHSSIPVSNPVMVAVDSRHHMSLHPSFSSNSGTLSFMS